MEHDFASKKDFLEHSRQDKENFESIHKKLATLATKEDIEQILNVFKNLKMAGQIIAGGSKWGYRALIVVATLVFVIATITGALKGILLALLGWALPKPI